MSTWQTIFGVEPPVRGVLSEFSSARDTFENMRVDAQSVVDQFQNFSDAGFVDGHLNGPPGQLVTQLLSEADGGLRDLPRVANEARGIFADHYTALDGLVDRADQALARAKTAWDRKNDLLGQQSSLSSQISGLNDQQSNAPAGSDTTQIDTDLSSAQGSLSSVNGELSTVQGTLDSIYGNDDSDYNSIRNDENDRNDTTIEALDGIDLGSLEDPGFWDKVGDVIGAIGDFLGGILENIADLVGALISGDWATFFWELKGLLDVALLVLGTIALFTGIGGPLGVLLIGLAVASLAVNTGLYLSETPNPQTGQRVGLLDVGISALGVVASGAGLLRVVKNTTAINIAARGNPRLQTTFAQQFSAFNAAGWRNGSIVSLFRNSGHHAANGITRFANASGRYGQLPLPFAVGVPKVTQVVDPVSGLVTGLKASTQQGLPVTLWSARSTIGGVQNFTPYALPGDSFRVTGSRGNVAWDASPPPTPSTINRVVQQARQEPNVVIVPAGP